MDRLVLYVPFPMLHPVIDRARLAAVHPGIEVVTEPVFEISHNERNAREKDPFGDATRALSAPLTEAQRAAFAQAHVLWTLDAPLDLPSVAPQLRFVQTIGSGVGQYVASRLPDGGIELANGAGLGAVVAELVPHKIEFPNLIVHMSAANAAPVRAWHEVSKRGLDFAGYTGCLEFLDPTRTFPLFRLNLADINIVDCNFVRAEASAEAIKRVRFELSIGSMDVDDISGMM